MKDEERKGSVFVEGDGGKCSRRNTGVGDVNNVHTSVVELQELFSGTDGYTFTSKKIKETLNGKPKNVFKPSILRMFFCRKERPFYMEKVTRAGKRTYTAE